MFERGAGSGERGAGVWGCGGVGVWGTKERSSNPQSKIQNPVLTQTHAPPLSA
jgi:hypothetical protein